MKLTREVTEKIIELANSGMPIKDIPQAIERTLRISISRRSVFNALEQARVPNIKSKSQEVQTIQPREKLSITSLVSIRLLYFCDDIELLTKIFAREFCHLKPEKIYVSSRVQKIVDVQKINKIVNIIERVGLKCNMEFEKLAV